MTTVINAMLTRPFLHQRLPTGFSLIEVITALTISAFVLTASTGLLQRAKQNYLQIGQQNDANAIADRSFHVISQRLLATGYRGIMGSDVWGQNDDSSLIEPPATMIDGSLYDLRYPVELNDGNFLKPSNYAIDFDYETQSRVLTVRTSGQPLHLTRIDNAWVGEVSEFRADEIALLSTATQTLLARIAGRSNIGLTTHDDLPSHVGDQIVLRKISGVRFYVRKNSQNDYALWQQRIQSSNANKVINEQLIEKVRYFFVQVGYGTNPIKWAETIAMDNKGDITALRIGIVVALPRLHAEPEPKKPATITVLEKSIPVETSTRYYPFEWTFLLARYRQVH